MSKQTIVIDGEGITVTHNSVAMADVNTVSFGIKGEREEINLTTIDAVLYMVGLLSDLEKLEDIVVNKKFDPAADLAMTNDNAELAITYKTGKANTKTITWWAQRKSNANATGERSPSDGINHDVTFYITNLNGSLVETGPVISS